MGWPLVAAAGIAAASAMHQQISGQKAQEKANKENQDFQREMAQNSISYRVQDARNAGIHPLYALGAQPYQAPVTNFSPDMSGIGQAGTAIANGFANYFQYKQQQRQNQQQIEMNDLQIQNMKLKNQGLQNEITANSMGQTLGSSNRSQVPFFNSNIDNTAGQADLKFDNVSRGVTGLSNQAGSFYQLESVTGKNNRFTLGVQQDKADLVSEDLMTKAQHYKLKHNPFATDRHEVIARQLTYQARAMGDIKENERLKPVWSGLIDGWEYEVVPVSFSGVSDRPSYLGARARHRGVYYGE